MNRTAEVRIGDRAVGDGEPCFVIAEAGVNHNGDLRLAKKLVDIAKEAGADAVKFQTFRAEDVVTASASKADYQKRTTGAGESQFEMIRKLELAGGDYREIASYCLEKDIVFLSTPFDSGSVDLLEEIGVAAYKIASGEITNFPLMRHIARKGKPVILSSGMSTLREVEKAVRCIEGEGQRRIVLLHCTSNYPASAGSVNLKAIDTLRKAFGYPVGFSDHTEGIMASVLAASMGACIVEKHFTVDRGMPGPDHQASLEPAELKALVKAIRDARTMMGDGIKRPAREEESIRRVARRSVVAGTDIEEGAVIGENMLNVKRPGTGIEPALMGEVVGKVARRRIPKDTLIGWEMIE
jgi:N-acetylneuraminate synthase/N,N'-diacetyllegionaminate synthase